LDHVGKDARYLGAMQLVQYISAHREYFVLTGDFNATPEAREIKLITEALAPRGAVDCTADLGGTFHNFGRLLPDRTVKIDYIFTDASCISSYVVEDIPVDGQYYSDHNAVCAMIEFA
jgi:endonuclease/exonuclease/phosphatase family metal-dependent hydrolase